MVNSGRARCSTPATTPTYCTCSSRSSWGTRGPA